MSDKKKKDKYEYTELKIAFNTIVPKGAVQEKAIYKSDDGSFIHQIPIMKADASKLEMYTIWYGLNMEDSEGFIIKKQEVLDNAQLDFMANGKKTLVFTHEKDEKDQPVMVEANLKDLWCIKKGDPTFPEKKHIGAIAGCYKFKNKKDWEAFKKQDWETSIEGKGKYIKLEKVKMEPEKDVVEKDFAEDMKYKNIMGMTYTLEGVIGGIMRDKDISDKPAEILASIDQYKEAINKELFVPATPAKKGIKEVVKSFFAPKEATGTNEYLKLEDIEKNEGEAMKADEVKQIVLDVLKADREATAATAVQKGKDDEYEALKKTVADQSEVIKSLKEKAVKSGQLDDVDGEVAKGEKKEVFTC